MRMQMTSQIDAGGNDPIFLMFHGYGNDESEMVRILDAVYAPTRADAAPAALAAVPSYISFRATYARPYMGGNYWYPDGCGVDERQRECAAVGDAVASLLDASAFAHRRKILIGFSQGGYLSYRLVKVHPTLFDAAILLLNHIRRDGKADADVQMTGAGSHGQSVRQGDDEAKDAQAGSR